MLEAVFLKTVDPAFDFGNAEVSGRCNNPFIRELLKNYVTMWHGVFLNDNVGVDVGGVGVVRARKPQIEQAATAQIGGIVGRTDVPLYENSLPENHNGAMGEMNGGGGGGVGGVVGGSGSGGVVLSAGTPGEDTKHKDEETRDGSPVAVKRSPLRWEIWVDMSLQEQQLITNLMSKMNHNRTSPPEDKEKGKEIEEREKEKERGGSGGGGGGGGGTEEDSRCAPNGPCHVVKVEIKTPLFRPQLLDTLQDAVRQELMGQHSNHRGGGGGGGVAAHLAQPALSTLEEEETGAGHGVRGGYPLGYPFLRKIKEEALSISTGDVNKLGMMGHEVKISVLLVEDNKINQRIAERMLRRGGEGWMCEVDLAENGAEAVKAYMKKKYDLVFMDCNMPGKHTIFIYLSHPHNL